MCKAGRKVLMVVGLVMMCVVSIVFGFVETKIPNAGYLGMWVLCAGAVYYGSGAEISI